ncbi:MAG: rRNA maturation RNase YbeY [Lachnospiraceae bacterium]|nr:rRNA maturation RNase YbeY [Lachnospiraceae bacterium]
MTIHLDSELEDIQLQEALPFDYEAVAVQVVEQILDQEGCPYEATVDILLTTEEAIREINRDQRDIDKATDVLSFPMVSYEAPSDFSILEDADGCFDPDTGELLLGDIILSVPRILEQAAGYQHSRKREYAFLIAHSMLHLLGYDHMEPQEAKEMERRQEQALQTLHITREEET